MKSLQEFAPAGVEAGVGLALQNEQGDYLFFLAGTRHLCPPGELFYAGIGGHLEAGEDWIACAHREAREEIGVDVELVPADMTWYLPHDTEKYPVEITDSPRPLALYEMIHPPDSPRAGQLYRIVIYQARLTAVPQHLPPDEVAGILSLRPEQVKHGLLHRPTLAELLAGGATIVAGAGEVHPQTVLYPIGTAAALALIL